MRLLPLFACVVLLAATMGVVTTAERGASPGPGSVWVEGSWEQAGGEYSWRPGYWQTATVSSAPTQTWVEGRWAQGANGWVWVEGHYETPPAVVVSNPPQQVVYTPPPQVVYTPPPEVVYVQRPQTTVVVNAGFGYGNYGYHRPACPPVTYCPPVVYHRPVTYCPPVVHHRPVTYCPPVVHHRPPVTYCPPVRPHVTVGVALPRPSIGFHNVSIGHHKLPIPVPVPNFRNRR